MAGILRRVLKQISEFWNGTEQRVFDPHTRLLETAGFELPQAEFGIEILNDRTTPIEFVIEQLVAHIGLSNKEALEATCRIHMHGGAFIPLGSEAEALRAASTISQTAQAQGYPLICRFVDFRHLGAPPVPSN
jgi:ATP-dependent Clp protease adapter protein ClpS